MQELNYKGAVVKATSKGDRVHLSVTHDGESIITMGLTPEQAESIALQLMLAAMEVNTGVLG